MIRMTVLYSSGDGKTFDHDYYANKHMPLVQERLKSFGIVRTEVDKGVAGGAPGVPGPYIAIGHVYFDTLADFQKGMGQHDKERLGDVSNFTSIQPQIQISEIIG
jgi:uncharacterized protein (TIGR02118 family)